MRSSRRACESRLLFLEVRPTFNSFSSRLVQKEGPTQTLDGLTRFLAMRVVAEEDFIPLGVPIVGRDGKEMSEIRVPKGTTIYPCASPLPLPPS